MRSRIIIAIVALLALTASPVAAQAQPGDAGPPERAGEAAESSGAGEAGPAGETGAPEGSGGPAAGPGSAADGGAQQDPPEDADAPEGAGAPEEPGAPEGAGPPEEADEGRGTAEEAREHRRSFGLDRAQEMVEGHVPDHAAAGDALERAREEGADGTDDTEAESGGADDEVQGDETAEHEEADDGDERSTGLQRVGEALSAIAETGRQTFDTLVGWLSALVDDTADA